MNIIITIETDEEVKVNVSTEGIEEKSTNVETDGEKKAFESHSQYARFFDEGCAGWSRNPELNKLFLMSQERYFTEKLKTKGYVFLNDVYETLGIPASKAGQVVGWIYDEEHPIGDNFVDFGLTDEINRDFINGYFDRALLDFNVDGNILNYM